jgi:hypothetical protein
MKTLGERTEEFLGHSISTATAAVAHMVAIYEENIPDAFEYVGLEFVAIDVIGGCCAMLYETPAAYAGYNSGLCTHYTDPPSYREEAKTFPDETIFNALFTEAALTVPIPVVVGAHYSFEPRYRWFGDFDLGHDSRIFYPDRDIGRP